MHLRRTLESSNPVSSNGVAEESQSSSVQQPLVFNPRGELHEVVVEIQVEIC